MPPDSTGVCKKLLWSWELKASGQGPPLGIPSLGVFPHTPSFFLEKTNIQPLPGLWIQTLALCGGEPHQIQLVALNLPHKLWPLLFQRQPLLPRSGPSSLHTITATPVGAREDVPCGFFELCPAKPHGKPRHQRSPTGTLSRVGFRHHPRISSGQSI